MKHSKSQGLPPGWTSQPDMDPNQNSRSPQVRPLHIWKQTYNSYPWTAECQQHQKTNKSITKVILQPLAYSLHGADAVRVPSLPTDISQQIAKYDSSEFDDDKEVAGGDAEGFDCKYFSLQQSSLFVSRRIC